MLVSWSVGQQVWWMWNCGRDGHSLDSQITSRPAPIQRMLNNQHQQQGYAAFVQQSPVWCAMMDGFSHRGAVRKLTLSRQIPSDTFQPAIACLLSNGLSAILDDCEAFLMIASMHRYGVVHISRNWKWWPQRSPSAYNCYQFLYTFCPYAMKSNLLADPLISLLIVRHNWSDDGRWCHIICDRPSPTGLLQVWQVTTPPSDPS